MSDQEYLADMVRGPRDYRIEFEIEQRKRIGGQYEKTREGYKIPHEFARGILAPQIQCLYLISRKKSNEIKLQKLNNSLFITSRNVFAPDRTRQEIQNKYAV